MIRRLQFLSRETTIAVVAGIALVFTGWAWGGVVLWTQWVVLGLGSFALALALAPEHPGACVTKRPSRVSRFALAIGLALAGALCWQDLVRLRTEREDSLLLIPSATFEPMGFAQWGHRGLMVGLGVALGVPILSGLLSPTNARRRLTRFPLFWIGLSLFAWIACQSLNPWGVIVQRDLVWKLVPQEHTAWLPSGVSAPFESTEEPGGMNGWRQILIFSGPWALLCALRVAVLRRRAYAWLAALAVANGLGVAIVGNIGIANKWRDFLGFRDPDLQGGPFGPFVYRNHAGAFLFLCAALAVALMFHLAKSRGDKVDRGGPHLLAGFAALLLVLSAASTMSFGSTIAAFALLLVVAPASYLLDRGLRENLSPVPALAIVALGGLLAYVGLLSADAKKWRAKFERKQEYMSRTGADDRAPLRNATWQMIESPDPGRAVSGWGGGSYRWVSPPYMARQPEFLDKRGVLIRRASYAHNDWLQAIAEWGAAGWMICACAVAHLLFHLSRSWQRPRASSLALVAALSIFAVHAWYDFLLFQPQMVLLAVLIGWLSVLERDEPSRQ